jgi:hypothetical protein
MAAAAPAAIAVTTMIFAAVAHQGDFRRAPFAPVVVTSVALTRKSLDGRTHCGRVIAGLLAAGP